MPNPASAGLPNPASYRDNGDGTVTDNITCLTWQKTVSSPTYTVDAGRAYCATLGAGWRMATRVELASINDFTLSGAKFPAPLSATGGFFKTGSEWVLTTKQIGAGAGTDFGWAYNFSDGIVSNARSGATGDKVRCVRGGGDDPYDTAPGALAVAPPNQYTVVATGDVRQLHGPRVAAGLLGRHDGVGRRRRVLRGPDHRRAHLAAPQHSRAGHPGGRGAGRAVDQPDDVPEHQVRLAEQQLVLGIAPRRRQRDRRLGAQLRRRLHRLQRRRIRRLELLDGRLGQVRALTGCTMRLGRHPIHRRTLP